MEKKTYTKEKKQHRNKKYVLRKNGLIYKTEIMALQQNINEQDFFYSSIFFDWTRYVDLNVPFPEHDYNSFNYSTVITDLCHNMRKEFLKEYPTVVCIIKHPEKFTNTSNLAKSFITIQLSVPLIKEKKLIKGTKAKTYFELFKHVIDDLDEIVDRHFVK